MVHIDPGVYNKNQGCLEMIKLMDKNQIIKYHTQGMSNRAIAKSLGINRKTVNKYVNEYIGLQSKLCVPSLSEDEKRKVTDEIVATPSYPQRKYAPRKWNSEMDNFLDKILASEEKKNQILKFHKQNLTITQIYKLFVKEGFDISFTTVRNQINERRAKAKEVFIAQDHKFGQRFEYDFGEVKLEISGVVSKYYLAVMCAPASGYRYALLYKKQTKEVFIDSQVKFFEHLGGCFEQGVYDNMRNVVTKFIGRNEKQLNDHLIRLSLYYGFNINVTNCFSGNEKGSVENAVKVVRNAAFAHKWSFDSFSKAQDYLKTVLAELNEDKPIEEEKLHLSAYRHPYEAADLRPGSCVDKRSCVKVDNVSYSVPEVFAGKKVFVKLYPMEVIVESGGIQIAKHERSFVKGDIVLDINHYLCTLRRKPGALQNSIALAVNQELKDIFDRQYQNCPREFIDIILKCKDIDLENTYTVLKNHGASLINEKKPDLNIYSDVTDDKIAAQTLAQVALIYTPSKGGTVA